MDNEVISEGIMPEETTTAEESPIGKILKSSSPIDDGITEAPHDVVTKILHANDDPDEASKNLIPSAGQLNRDLNKEEFSISGNATQVPPTLDDLVDKIVSENEECLQPQPSTFPLSPLL